MATSGIAPFALLTLLVVGGLIALIVVLCTRKKQPPQPPTQQVALCPNCGTPVSLGNGRWHCMKCGSGDVLLTPPPQ